MVRLHWHVEDGKNAFVPPGTMKIDDKAIAHADVHIEARRRTGSYGLEPADTIIACLSSAETLRVAALTVLCCGAVGTGGQHNAGSVHDARSVSGRRARASLSLHCAATLGANLDSVQSSMS